MQGLQCFPSPLPVGTFNTCHVYQDNSLQVSIADVAVDWEFGNARVNCLPHSVGFLAL